jgi:WD40 repeat protein
LPDGKSLVTTELRHGIQVWDVATAKPIRAFGEGCGEACRIAMAPDGKTIAVDHFHRVPDRHVSSIILWDLVTGKEIRQIGRDQGVVYALAFSADGATLACSGGGRPDLWDVATGKTLLELDNSLDIPINTRSVAFTPDGKSLLAGGPRFLAEWSLITGQVVRSYPVGTADVFSLALSPDGKSVVTGGTRTVRLWDRATTQPKFDSGGHHSWIGNVAFSRNGKEVITGGDDRTIIRWDLATGKETARFTTPAKNPSSLFARSPNDKTFVLEGDDQALLVVDAYTGKEHVRFLKAGWSRGAVFTPDSKAVISFVSGLLRDDSTIRVWEADTGKEILVIPASPENSTESYLTGIALSPDGKTLYCTHYRAPIQVLDVATGKELRRFGVPESGFYQPTLSSDGRYLACASGKSILVLETNTGKQFRELPYPSGTQKSVGFSPDGRTLAVSSDQEPLRLWEIASGQARLEVSGHAGPVQCFAFSPDGRFLATGSDDTTALLWDPHTLALGKSPNIAQPTPKLLDTLWSELFGDAPVAYRAVARLSGFPKETVVLLGGRLSSAEAKPLDKLIAKLDDDDSDVRESATKELITSGVAASAAMRKAMASAPSVEVRVRLEKILAQNRLGLLRSLEVLETIGTPEAQKLVESLARGAELAELTVEAKATLVRMERTPRRE